MEEDVLRQPLRLPAVTLSGGGAGRLGSAIAAVAVALTGCTSGSSGRSLAPSSTTTSTVTVPDVPLEGRFFAVAGERSGAADLYELKSGPLRLNRLTTDQRVSAIGGCNTLLVAAAAQVQVGLVDTIQVFRNGSFGPVAGLGMPKGFVPALNPDCGLAFTDIDRSTPDLINRLHVWDPKSRTDTVLEHAADLSGLNWGPGGRLAVVVNQGGSQGQAVVSISIVVIAPDGSKKTVSAPAPDLGGLAWGASRTMAFVRRNAKATLFFNPDSGARSELAGWFPLAWSPDGQQLLVTDSGNHTELGVVAASDLGTVRRVWTAPLGVFGGVWLPADATPETSLP
jgi:hypothetical protein